MYIQCLGDRCITQDLFNMYIHRPLSGNDFSSENPPSSKAFTQSFHNTEFQSTNLKSSEATSDSENSISDLVNSKYTETTKLSVSPDLSIQLLNLDHSSNSFKTNDETSSKYEDDPTSTFSEINSGFTTEKTLTDIKNTNYQSFNELLSKSDFTLISTKISIPNSKTKFESKAATTTRITKTNSRKEISNTNSGDEFDLIYLVPIFLGIFALLILVTTVILIYMFKKKMIFNRA